MERRAYFKHVHPWFTCAKLSSFVNAVLGFLNTTFNLWCPDLHFIQASRSNTVDCAL